LPLVNVKLIEGVFDADWGIGGTPLSTADVKALAPARVSAEQRVTERRPGPAERGRPPAVPGPRLLHDAADDGPADPAARPAACGRVRISVRGGERQSRADRVSRITSA
jgi:hypothetical protein